MIDGLKDQYRQAIINILAANKRVERVELFGSRAMQTFTTTSDVDLVLYGDELTMTDQAKLAAAIEEMPMPQRVDLLLYKSIDNEKLQEHIKKHGVEWYRRGGGNSSGWPLVSLKDAGISLIDCDHKTPKAQDQGMPYVGIPQLKEGRITLDGVRLITEEDFGQWRRKAKPTPNDVILSRRCNPGETAYVPEDLEIALGQNLVLLRSDGKKIYPPFLRWIAQGQSWWNQIGKFINVGAVFDSLKCVDIPNFEIKLPPMECQKNIANILGSLDDKIELNRRINQTLEQIAQTIFKSWFVDFEPVKAKIEAKQNGQDPERAATAALFPDELVDSELGLIPKGWEVGIIGDLFELHRGFDLPKSQRIDGIYPVYAAGGIHGDHVEYKIDPPGIITGRSGVIGNVFLSLEKFWPLNTTLYVRNYRMCGPYYAYHLLRSFDLSALNSGSAVPSLNRNFVHSAVCLMPGKKLLEFFEKYVGIYFEAIKHKEKEALTLSILRDTLLPKLLSCEIPIESYEKVMEVV